MQEELASLANDRSGIRDDLVDVSFRSRVGGRLNIFREATFHLALVEKAHKEKKGHI